MENDDDAIEREERGIYLVMFLAGLPIIGVLVIENRTIDGGNALILGIVMLGVVGLVAGLKAMVIRKLPRARLLRPSDRAADSRRRPR